MGLVDAPLGFALAAGSVAAFNPCGFAMLPAYLSFFLADGPAAVEGNVAVDDRKSALEQRSGRDDDSRHAVGRALLVSGVMTLGFTVVFGLAGLAIQGASLAVGEFTPWFTIAMGLLLVPVGLAMLAGRSLKVQLPRLQQGGRDRGMLSMALFGASYATVSLSCTLPVFLTAVSGSFRAGDLVAGTTTYLAYAVGMGLVVATLTVALALTRDGLVRRLKGVMPHLNRIAGGFVALAGAYVAYYGWFEVRTLAGEAVAAGPVDWVTRWSASVSSRVEGAGAIVALAVLVAVVALGVTAERRQRPRHVPDAADGPVPAEPADKAPASRHSPA